MAAELSRRRMKLIGEADVIRIHRIFLQAGLPVVAPAMPVKSICN
jgi:shikimate kinase/3-dehydroquinate synthase